ncbi:MAG: hypothetical protein IJV71_03005, partial [Lachnospiraceae bacterium]|nr:hypothetical protein [Lachnospiraceae bacterium]
DYPGIMDAFATKDYVTNAIKNMDLLGFATRDYVTQVIVGGGVDLSEYVTDTELSGVLNNYVTNYVFNNALNNKSDKSHTHDNYATTTYVNDVVSNINLDGYVTDEEMAQALIDFAGSGSIDLSSYVTEKELQEALSNFSGGGDVDLSGYVTDTELNTALSNKADKSHTHDSYATKTYVHDVIANADLDNYVTDEELSNILANMPDNTYDDTELRGLIAAKADGTHSHSEYIVADAVDGVWVGTQDEYNAIIHIDPNILYFIQEDGI